MGKWAGWPVALFPYLKEIVLLPYLKGAFLLGVWIAAP